MLCWKNFSIFFLIFPAMLELKAQQKINTLKEVVVSDTRFKTDFKKTGKSVVVLTKKYLQANKSKAFHQILNQVPGLEISGTHGNFENLSTYVRGGRNHTVIVLIDGQLMTDPSGITIAYDLRNIDISQIEKVEIVKGGLSAIYGSNAGTVINITTKKIKKGKFKGNAYFEHGSWHTVLLNGFLSRKTEKYEIGIHANFLGSKGFSSAKDKNNTGTFDKDGYSKKNIQLKGSYNVFDKLKLNFSGALNSYKYDYDSGAFKDSRRLDSDTQKTSKYKWAYSFQNYAKISAIYLLKKGAIRLSYAYNHTHRIYREGFYGASSDPKGNTEIGQFSFSKEFFGRLKTMLGVDYQKLSFEGANGIGKTWEIQYKGNYRIIDPYFSGVLEYKGFYFHFASRFHTHSNYGNTFVYTINPSYLHTITDDFQVKTRIHYSTNFVAPSLYQSYSKYGNTNLKPMNANTIEAGISGYFQNTWRMDFTMYQRNEHHGIIYKKGKYENLSASRKVAGIEWILQYTYNEKLNFSANYATAKTDKKESFLRIPEIKYGGQIIFTPFKNLDLNLQYNYTGERADVYYEGSKKKEVVLAPIHLVDCSLNYNFLEGRFVIFAAIKNLLDRDYVGVVGYNTRRRNFSFGVTYKF